MVKIHAAITGRKHVAGVEYVEGEAFKFDNERAVNFGAIISRFFQLETDKVFAYGVQWHRTTRAAKMAAEADGVMEETTVTELRAEFAV